VADDRSTTPYVPPTVEQLNDRIAKLEKRANDAWAAAHMERDRGDRWEKIADQRAIEVADLQHDLKKAMANHNADLNTPASETAPPSALSLEYAGRQGYIEGYADALKDLGQQSANMPTIPGADKIVSVTRAFDYVSEREGHSPWVMVYFPPNDWASRDAFAAALPAPADSEAKDA
jgi:hypothetical protein